LVQQMMVTASQPAHNTPHNTANTNFDKNGMVADHEITIRLPLSGKTAFSIRFKQRDIPQEHLKVHTMGKRSDGNSQNEFATVFTFQTLGLTSSGTPNAAAACKSFKIMTSCDIRRANVAALRHHQFGQR
jgi:hypothetical protein